MEKNHRASLLEISEKLACSVKDLMAHVKTEEDLRIGFEKMLEPILQSIGVESHPKYERHGLDIKTVFKGRPDAVHGQVIIEYEAPRAFSSKRAVSHAFEQLTNYMSAEARGQKSPAGGGSFCRKDVEIGIFAFRGHGEFQEKGARFTAA